MHEPFVSLQNERFRWRHKYPKHCKKKKNLLHVLFQFQSPVYHNTLFYIISTKKVNVELCDVSRIFNSDLHLAKVGFSINSDLYWFIEPLD